MRSLCRELNEEGVSLAYVLRKTDPPKTFASLHEKLEYLLPLNVAGDISVDDSGIGETTGMAGICNVPAKNSANFSPL